MRMGCIRPIRADENSDIIYNTMKIKQLKLDLRKRCILNELRVGGVEGYRDTKIENKPRKTPF